MLVLPLKHGIEILYLLYHKIFLRSISFRLSKATKFAAPFCVVLRLWKTISSLSDCRLNIISFCACKIEIINAYLYFIPLLCRPFIINLSKTAATQERIISYAYDAVRDRYVRQTVAQGERSLPYARDAAWYRYAH